MMPPTAEHIEQVVQDKGEFVSINALSTEIHSPYWWTRECAIRLEREGRICIDRPGPGLPFRITPARHIRRMR